jgi:hypothetical protein
MKALPVQYTPNCTPVNFFKCSMNKARPSFQSAAETNGSSSSTSIPGTMYLYSTFSGGPVKLSTRSTHKLLVRSRVNDPLDLFWGFAEHPVPGQEGRQGRDVGALARLLDHAKDPSPVAIPKIVNQSLDVVRPEHLVVDVSHGQHSVVTVPIPHQRTQTAQ